MPPNRIEFRRTGTAPPGAEASGSPGNHSKSASAPVPGSSFAARFGQVILSDGIAAIPSALFHYQRQLGLTAQQVWFISYILAHKWTSDLPYPSMNKMARCAGVTRRVLQYRCNELHNCGYLKIYPRRGEKNDQDTNAYDFSELFRHMEELLSEDEQPNNPVRADGRSPGVDDYAEYDPSFVARYGRVISKHGISAIPRALFTHQNQLGLSPQQVWFVCYIFSFQWDTALPYPSLRKMAERTGYSRQQIINIKASLVEAGYLRLVTRYNENGQDSNAYDFSGLLEAIRKQLQPDQAGEESVEAQDENAQEEPDVTAEPSERRRPIGRQRQSRQSRFPAPDSVDDGSRAPGRTGSALPGNGAQHGVEHSFTGGIAHQLAGRVEQGFTRGLEQRLAGPVSRASIPPANADLPRGQKGVLPEVESSQIEANQEEDYSNHNSPKRKFVTTDANRHIPGYSRYIAQVATDFSLELGDSAHEASNIKQALNLWRESGLGEVQFVDVMQEARKRTRKYQSRPTWDAMDNKMAYFYATLRSLLGLGKEE